MAPDRRLVDLHQVEVAQELCRDAIAYTEQQLGSSTLRPPTGRALIRRLAELERRLKELEGVIGAIAAPFDSENRTAPH